MNPAWHVLLIGGRRLAAVAHDEGRWTVVAPTGSAGGDTLDEALSRALRRASNGPA